jgi:hypothetical protein
MNNDSLNTSRGIVAGLVFGIVLWALIRIVAGLVFGIVLWALILYLFFGM